MEESTRQPLADGALQAYRDLRDRVARFVAEAPCAPPIGRLDEAWSDRYDSLATEVCQFQCLHLPPLQRLWRGRGLEPLELDDWRAAPPVPTAAFKTEALHVAAPERVFRSSGTTRGGERRSAHHHGEIELYRQIVDRTFPLFVLRQAADRPHTLALVPPSAIVPDSSLAFMVEHVLERYSGGDSRYAYGAGGLHVNTASSWLQQRVERGEPALLLCTAIALWDLCVELERRGETVQLPADSVVFETGGFKTSEGEIRREELLERIEAALAVRPSDVVREYGMSELTSQAYTEVLRGGAGDRFVCPPWMRVRILEPTTLEECGPGETGLVSILDLGNVGSVASLLTEDLAVADAEGGFELRGRARGAELRGCSLLAEQLADR
ncbi:MAG: hypothetical protein DWQ36_00845 [Acidobacteria bacterium]|nr:MAG: hypothetical protein DWQ36_00845 [Acidobacteriota bacterium]